MQPYMWCLLGTKAGSHLLIQNRFYSEWDSSRPTNKSLKQGHPQRWCGLTSDLPKQKKFAINTLDGGVTVPSKTTHTERVETTVRHRTPYA